MKTNYCQIFLFISLFSSCVEKNYGECSQKKDDITEMTTVEEKEDAETKKYSATCTMTTYEEDAIKLINQASAIGDGEKKSALYLEAAQILSKLVEFYPDEYDRYGVLAACHAGVGGVELLSFLTSFSSADNQSIFDSGKDLLPSPEDDNYDLAKEHMERAAFWIDEKVRLQNLQVLPKGDQLQSAIYRMAYTFILANGILSRAADGTWDMNRIENMSAEDVDALIENLDAVASTLPADQAAQFQQYKDSNQLSDEQKKELIKQAIARQ